MPDLPQHQELKLQSLERLAQRRDRAFSKLTAPRRFRRTLSCVRNRPGPEQKQTGIRQHPLNRCLDP